MPNMIYCEDNSEHIEMFKKNFCGEDSVLWGYTVTVCRTSGELMSLVKRLRPDIVLTDIELNDGTTGIEAAEELLSLSPRTQIIYVTSYTDKFIQDVFLSRANVCGFLNKPIERSYFKKMVKKAEKRAAKDRTVTLTSGRETFTVYERDIIYAESCKRRITFHFKGGRSCEVYGTLSEQLERLSDRFIMTHQSFIVNKIYVAGIRQNELFVTDGTVIPISRQRLKTVKALFIDEAEKAAAEK